MKLARKIAFWVLAVFFLTQCGPEQKKVQKLDRKILGEELKFGRQAAKFELWNEAIFRWEKVIQEEPDNHQAMNNLAVAYETVGDYEKAKNLYETAIELREDSPDIRKNYKRFLSFYKKHLRQLARERAQKERERKEKEEGDSE